MENMSEQRLANIEAKQERLLTLLEGLSKDLADQSETAEKWRARIERTMYGDGNGYLGMVVRLDRLEQALERGKWLTRAIAGAVVTLLVGAAWSLLTG